MTKTYQEKRKQDVSFLIHRFFIYFKTNFIFFSIAFNRLFVLEHQRDPRTTLPMPSFRANFSIVF